MNITILTFTLLIVFVIKHFLADFPLQTPYMLGKFKQDWGFVPPLLAHVGVHAAFTFAISIWFGIWQAFCLAAFDATVHFVMDRIKASKKYLGRFKPLTEETYFGATPEQLKSNRWYFYSLGIDQGIHTLTDMFVVWCLVRGL